jgi:hypothetical protein
VSYNIEFSFLRSRFVSISAKSNDAVDSMRERLYDMLKKENSIYLHRLFIVKIALTAFQYFAFPNQQILAKMKKNDTNR